MATDAPTPPRRLLFVDLLRAACIVYITGFWHLQDYLPGGGEWRNVVTVRITVVILGLFTLVSGFLMAQRPPPPTRAGTAEFFRKRFARLYPPFVLASLLFALLGIAGSVELLKGLALVAMPWGPPPMTLWFVTMVCLFYAATPWLLRLRRRPAAYVSVTLSAAVMLLLACRLVPLVDHRLAIYFPAYATGIWLADRPALRWWPLALLLYAAGLALTAALPVARVPESLASLPLALGGAALLFVAGRSAEARLPDLSGVRWIADGSYFLYLFHRPAYTIGIGLAPSIPRPAVLLAVFTLAVVGAGFGQHAYDRWWQRWQTRLA